MISNLNLRAKSMLVVIIPLLMLIISVLSVFWSMTLTSSAEDNVQRSLKALSKIHAVHAQLAEAASGVRGYLYTNDPSFLQPYWRATQQMGPALTDMEAAIRDPQQSELVQTISNLVTIKMENLEALRLQAEVEQNAPLQQVLVDEKALLDLLRERIVDMENREQIIIDQFTERVNFLRQRNLIIAILAAVLGIFSAISASWLFANSIVSRVRLIGENAKRLEQNREQQPVQPSQDELGQLARRIETAGELLATRAREAQSARLEAELANQAKTDFLSRISHELRTPLNAILGFAQLLERDLHNPSEKRSIELIHSSGLHLLQLVNDVLDISRIESGHLLLSLQPIDLQQTLAETIAMTQRQAQTNHVHVICEANTESSCYVDADRHRLLQVLLNLVSNAIKYNQAQGQVIISVAEEGADQYRVCIDDTGAGISEALKATLFTPFARGNNQQIEGTGLGLAVSKSLIEAMGGHIGYEPSPRLSGTRFWFTLSKSQSTASTQAADIKPILPTASLAVENTAKSVLYIEDDAANSVLVEAIFSRLDDIKLTLIDNGEQGLAHILEQPPLLVLLDLELPLPFNGEKVLSTLRQQYSAEELPIVILTANALPDTRQRLLAMGANHYLTKPFNISELIQLVRTYVK
ncbi:MAG: ATP-binding protein [Moraxellaceae bacterium]|nr:ATP-binding protein [Moraxellaceae bacterium]MDZ4387555.1 ATP-binding protein [Moraxellaceae bacterium]